MRIKTMVGMSLLVVFLWGVQSDPVGTSEVITKLVCALSAAGDQFVAFAQHLLEAH